EADEAELVRDKPVVLADSARHHSAGLAAPAPLRPHRVDLPTIAALPATAPRRCLEGTRVLEIEVVEAMPIAGWNRLRCIVAARVDLDVGQLLARAVTEVAASGIVLVVLPRRVVAENGDALALRVRAAQR